MTMTSSDAALVAGHLAGDPAALAGIYDRYANALHDTAAAMLNDRHEAADILHDVILIAAERLDQLRDPDRLKPWLFAILRNEVYRRSKQRRRTIATDFSGSDDGIELVDDRTVEIGTAVTDDVAGTELAELVRGAARGLDERDQLVLELSVRQGLGGQDLADALGVSANQSYTLVHRMRERVERSLAAYVVAKAGRGECGDLDKLLSSWDGEFTVLIRKRVSRHVDRCETCESRRRKVAPLVLFAGAPVYAAPPTLRDQILGAAALRTAAPSTPYGFTAHDGFPQVFEAVRRVAAWVAPATAAAFLLIVAGLSFVWIGTDRDGDTLREATAEFVTSTTPPSATTTPSPTVVAADPTPTDTAPTDTAPAATETVPGPTLDPTLDPNVDPTKGSAPDTTAPTTSPPATTPRTTVPGGPNVSTAPPPPTAAPVTPTTAPPTTIPPPGQLSISGNSINLGSSASSGSVTLTNTGGQPFTFSVSGNSGAFAVSPASGTIAPGASVSVTASIQRSNLPEGNVSASVLVFGAGSNFNVNLSASVERPPSIKSGSPQSGCFTGGAGQQVSFSSMAITDESGFSATLSVSGPGGLSGSATQSTSPVNVQVFAPGGGAGGTWSWSITATDTRGNSASTSGTIQVTC